MRQRKAKSSRTAGFTLIEVMISLFIVVVLLIGINLVFSTTANTISQGNQLNDMISNARGAQDTLLEDLQHVATDSPVFVISSDSVAAYESAADAQANNYNYPTSISPGTILTNTINGATLSTAVPSYRVHRVDFVEFFLRYLMSRQTGYLNSGGQQTFSSQLTGNEAFVRYGHGKFPTADLTNYYGPDDVQIQATSTTPNVARTVAPYAADWILAHTRIMLKSPYPNSYPSATPSSISEPGVTGGTEIVYNYSAPPTYNSPWAAGPIPMPPLSYGSYDSSVTSTPSSSSPNNQMDSSRYDVANVSMDQFRNVVTDAIRGEGATNLDIWWDPMIYTNPHGGGIGTRTGPMWDTYGNLRYRSRVSPSLLSRTQTSIGGQTGLQPRSAAEMSPFFLQHVSQFIVEYAGDFVSQDTGGGTTVSGNPVSNPNYGNITGLQGDGDIDWVLDTRGDYDGVVTYNPGDWVIDGIATVNGVTGPAYFQYTPTSGSPGNPGAPPASGWTAASATSYPQKRIRWYGYPRNLSGATKTPGPMFKGLSTTPPSFNELCDVVPLRDAWTLYYSVNPPASLADLTYNPYEVEEPLGDGLPRPQPYTAGTVTLTGMDNYSNATEFAPLTSATTATRGNYGRYVAVWRNNVPAMVRILIKVDNPNNAQATGPWFEYVFKLK